MLNDEVVTGSGIAGDEAPMQAARSRVREIGSSLFIENQNEGNGIVKLNQLNSKKSTPSGTKMRMKSGRDFLPRERET